MSRRDQASTRTPASLLPGLQIDEGGDRPLNWQFYQEIKRLVLDGIIPAGAGMPSPRLLASEYGCSRHTVATAYDYLVAEGILGASHGVGTFVADLPGIPPPGMDPPVMDAPGTSRISAVPPESGEGRAVPPPTASRFAAALLRGGIDRDEEDPLQSFGLPDSESFPYETWSRLQARIWSRPKRGLLRSVSAQGYEGLRQAVCDLAHRTRGIRATPDQVMITSGTTQSLDLLLRALLDPGDAVWVEDPGRPKAATLVEALGMRRVAVPVDRQGLQVDLAEARAPAAKAVIITASHHYPTGATLSLDRRLRLLAWARRTGGWIFEDDYDGEIIAGGQPILPIYSLGRNERVVYMGSFSKSISPQLRLGYVICHPALVQLLVRLRYYVDYFPSMSMQPVLAAFIAEGHLDAHIRRMRRAYRDRQAQFAAAIGQEAGDVLAVDSAASALFMTLLLRRAGPPGRDRWLAQQARRIGIPAFALSPFYFEAPPQPGVIIGTGRLDLPAIPGMVRQLAEAARRPDDPGGG
jgi:GntR family transcriptional regulator/MocR family aminotransferase